MRTRVIPAQITTVEDKIVGNLNLMQMAILIVPIFFTTLIYALLPPSMSFVIYKLVLSVIVLVVCAILSLRIKGKVVVNWLSILCSYNLRAKYFVYNKNEACLRNLYLPQTLKTLVVKEKTVKAKTNVQTTSIIGQVKNLMSLESFIRNEEIDFRYKIGKKGGLNVAFEQIKK